MITLPTATHSSTQSDNVELSAVTSMVCTRFCTSEYLISKKKPTNIDSYKKTPGDGVLGKYHRMRQYRRFNFIQILPIQYRQTNIIA